MTTEGYKTRFTKPYQTVQLMVPYDTGMDPYNGLLEVAVDMDIIQQKGSRYSLPEEEKTWYSKDFGSRQADVLAKCETQRDLFLHVDVDSDEIDFDPDEETSKQKRIAKAMGGKKK